MNTILVSDVYQQHGTASITMPSDTLLKEILSKFIHDPAIRGIFLVDSKQRYSGMVTMVDLLKWVHLKLTGGKGSHGIGISEFYRIVDARKASDLSIIKPQSLSVKVSDTLQIALDKMLYEKQDIVAVIDDDRRVLGDLRLSEILWQVITHGRDNLSI